MTVSGRQGCEKSAPVRRAGCLFLVFSVAVVLVLMTMESASADEAWVWKARVGYVEEVKDGAGSYTKKLDAEYELRTPVMTESGSGGTERWSDGSVRYSDIGRWHFRAIRAGEMSEPEKEIEWKASGEVAVKYITAFGEVSLAELKGRRDAVKQLRLPAIIVKREGNSIFVNDSGLSFALSVNSPGALTERSVGKTTVKEFEVRITANPPKEDRDRAAVRKSQKAAEEEAMAMARKEMERAMRAMEGKFEEGAAGGEGRDEMIAEALERAGFKRLTGTVVRGSRQWTSERVNLMGSDREVKVNHTLTWEFTRVQNQ